MEGKLGGHNTPACMEIGGNNLTIFQNVKIHPFYHRAHSARSGKDSATPISFGHRFFGTNALPVLRNIG